MAMQKFGDTEKVEILRGEQATVLNDHMKKTGKFKVSDFSKDEKAELQRDLEAVEDGSSAT